MWFTVRYSSLKSRSAVSFLLDAFSDATGLRCVLPARAERSAKFEGSISACTRLLKIEIVD